jgi:hypothetical protein
MIISHKYKFIFTAIPKTATHAIRFAVRPFLDDQDQEQVGLFVKKEFPYEELAKIQHGHIKCLEIKPFLGVEVWNSYFKFAIVRNPYDRFVSYCAFMNKNNPDFTKNPQPYMYQALLNKKTHKHILFIPQSDFICDANDQLMINYTGRYETLQSSYDTVCDSINLTKSSLETINSSTHMPYKEYYNDELKEMVYNFYKKDFIHFGYSKDLL